MTKIFQEHQSLSREIKAVISMEFKIVWRVRKEITNTKKTITKRELTNKPTKRMLRMVVSKEPLKPKSRQLGNTQQMIKRTRLYKR